MRIIFNAIIMVLELAAIAAVAWLGFQNPFAFAALTGVVALGLGLSLEIARLHHEMPFYFDRGPTRSAIFLTVIGGLDTVFKAILATVVALLTFLGTDSERLGWVAAIFAICLFIGCAMIRWLARTFSARPLRWGYFRLAAPLGLLFSGGLAMLPSPGLTELAKRVTFDLPEQPSLAQASEFLFLLKQSFDDVIEKALGLVVPTDWAQILSAVVSVNVFAGFVLALYAIVISEAVRRMESWV